MAKDKSPKTSPKWFHNKNLSLSFKCGRSISTLTSVVPPSPVSSPRTPLQKPEKPSKDTELKAVFARFDEDGDGLITAVELRCFFGSIGEYMSNEEAQSVIEELDSDGDKMLDFDDFGKLMKREIRAEEEDLKRAFEMFEMEKGSGFITPKGLQKVFHRLGEEKSYDQCVAMISAFDIDGNGVLDFHEFYQMMA